MSDTKLEVQRVALVVHILDFYGSNLNKQKTNMSGENTTSVEARLSPFTLFQFHTHKASLNKQLNF